MGDPVAGAVASQRPGRVWPQSKFPFPTGGSQRSASAYSPNWVQTISLGTYGSQRKRAPIIHNVWKVTALRNSTTGYGVCPMPTLEDYCYILRSYMVYLGSSPEEDPCQFCFIPTPNVRGCSPWSLPVSDRCIYDQMLCVYTEYPEVCCAPWGWSLPDLLPRQ